MAALEIASPPNTIATPLAGVSDLRNRNKHDHRQLNHGSQRSDLPVAANLPGRHQQVSDDLRDEQKWDRKRGEDDHGRASATRMDDLMIVPAKIASGTATPEIAITASARKPQSSARVASRRPKLRPAAPSSVR